MAKETPKNTQKNKQQISRPSRSTRKKSTTLGSGGLARSKYKYGLLVIVPVLAFAAIGGFMTFRSSAQTESQRFATEMYQRCYNTMKTSGSDHTFWVDYINKHGKNKAWAAFVEASGKPCSHPYPPVTNVTNSTPRTTPAPKRQPAVVTDYQKEARNRVEVSNAFVTNSAKELQKAQTLANKTVVEKKDLDAIQKAVVDIKGWVDMNLNFQNDITAYISKETDGTRDAYLKSMLDVVKNNHTKIEVNYWKVVEAHTKAIESNKKANQFFSAVNTPTSPVDQSQIASPSSCNISGGVHVSIVDAVNQMCAAAARDGVTLAGTGWRSYERQIELRRQNCGDGNYAIYQMPASSCSPPTAIPGRSQHEFGLAIDFKPCSHGSACFNWLSNNAKNYGFYNLPSESWHWSTTGS